MKPSPVVIRIGRLTLIALALVNQRAQAATGTTMTVAATDPTVNSTDGLCSLAEAIDNANAGSAVENPTPTVITTAGDPLRGISRPSHADCAFTGDGAAPYTIVLTTGQTYSFTAAPATNTSGTADAKAAAYRHWWYGPNALPAIASEIIIEGNGAVIERAASLTSATPFRIFYVGADPSATNTPGYTSPGAGNLTLRNLTLKNGLAKGGSGNGGGGGMGGAIFSQGVVSLDRVTISGSTAQGGNGSTLAGVGGGGMGSSGASSVCGGFGGGNSSSEFSGIGFSGGNSASAGGGGGAGFSAAGGNATSSAPGLGAAGGGNGGASSTAPLGGRAFGAGGSCKKTTASGGGGVGVGGAYSTNAGGQGGFGGGGSGSGTANQGARGGFGGGAGTNSSTSGFGGGIGGGGGAGLGGAVFNMQGTLSLSNTTLTANSAVGGASAGSGSSTAGQGLGGAIFNLNGTVTLNHATVARNTAGDGGAVYTLALEINNGTDATGIHTASLALENSILANSITATNDLVNNEVTAINPGTSTVTMTGANIVMASTNTGSTFTGTTPFTADPQLDTALAANGACNAPQTLALLSGTSPAVDAAVGSLLAIDQRRFARPAGSANDLGAYEFGASAPNGCDSTPDAFSFTNSSNAAVSGGEIASNSITISGIDIPATVTIANGSGSTGAMFSIAGGAFGTTGSISNGQSVQVEVNAAAACNTTTSATLTIGGVTSTYNVTTVACDTTPASFSFTAVTGATRSAAGVPSDTQTITGINTATAVTISGDTGAKFSIDGGAFGTSGNLTNSQTLQLEVDAAAICGTTTTANVTVGAGSAVPFNVTTTACDRTPDDFSLGSASGVEPSSAQVSNEITVAGVDDGTSISISPVGTFTIDGGSAMTSDSINSASKVIVQLAASASYSTTRTATLSVGTVNKDFSVSTRAGHTDPTPFSFDPVTGAEPGASVASSSTIVSGLEVAAPISIDTGQFCIGSNSNCFNNSLMTVSNNDIVYVRLTASNSYSTPASATLSIGSGSAGFTVTTRAADIVPDAFNFTAQTGVEPASSHTSSMTVSGIEAGVATSITGGTFTIGSDPTPLTSGTVHNGDVVTVTLAAASAPATKTTATLTIGGVSGKFCVTTRAALPVDLSLTQSANANPVQTGATGALTYSLTVHNNSATEAAYGVVVTATLASGLSFNTSNGSGWNCSAAADVVTCSLASLAQGGNSTVDIVVDTGASAGSIKTTGTVSTTNTDPTPANNSKNMTTLLCDPSGVDAIGFGATSFASTEGTGPVTITVNRSGTSCSSATVHYATTTGGSAAAGDFTAASGDFTWLPLDANKKTFAVPISNDSVFTGNRTVNLQLSSPSSNATLTKSTSAINIKDDEVPVTIGLSTSDQSVSEEGGVATVTATLSSARTVDTTVALSLTGTAARTKDYSLSAPSITIAAGTLSNSMTLTGVHDLLDEADETAIVKMAAVNGVAASGATTNTITLLDDDPTPTVSFDAVSSSRSESKANSVNLVLSAASSFPVTVNVSSTGGSATQGDDYTINASGTITIPAGSTTVTAVRIIDDTAHEGSETAVLQIDSATNATPSGIQATTLTITDNDP